MTNEAKSALLTRVEILEAEIAAIKAKLAMKATEPRVRLEGLWKGIEFSDEEIEEAEHSLFKEVDDI